MSEGKKRRTRRRIQAAEPPVRSNVPTKPGIYWYRLHTGSVWRHQEVFYHKQGVLAVLVVNQGDGLVPIKNMHRHWRAQTAKPK